MRTEFISNGVSPERIQTLPYPVIEAVPLENAPSTRAPIGNVLFMGRLTKLKGLDYLFSALVQAQKHLNFPLSLTVAGSGPEEVSLRRTAQRLPFKVNFAGWIDREAKSALLENADLLAVPSVWPEPFGLVGLEAACWGVPSVAFDVGGVSSWLDAGKTGEIAPGTPPKAQELSEAIVRALSNPEHFNRLRRGAWERSQHFNMRDHVARLEAVLISSHEQQAVTP
jgi:glycosyltransferase involved in cell wall biosynthesis